jgi:hypothetical protein
MQCGTALHEMQAHWQVQHDMQAQWQVQHDMQAHWQVNTWSTASAVSVQLAQTIRLYMPEALLMGYNFYRLMGYNSTDLWVTTQQTYGLQLNRLMGYNSTDA